MNIQQATRSTGNWFNENCNNRMKPCGNPECADNTMRAKDHLRQYGKQVSDEMMRKVRQKADKCLSCPLPDKHGFITNLFLTY